MVVTSYRKAQAIREELARLGERAEELRRALTAIEARRHLIRCQLPICKLPLLEIMPCGDFLVLAGGMPLHIGSGRPSFVVTCPSCGTNRAVLSGEGR